MKMTEKAMIGGCCICSVETGFENNPIVYCDGENCNLGVHQACYSIKSVPEGSWYCDVCKLGIDSVVCQFCPLKFGAFKKTNLDTWIHVICADFFNSICVNVGSQVCIDKSRLPDKNPCSLCVSENGFIGYTRACGGGCNKYFHITCAQISGTLAIKKLKLTQEKKLYRVYCKHHKVKYNNRSSLTFRKPFSYECYSDYSKIQNLNSNCLMLDENDVSKFKLSNFESGSIKSSNNGLTNIDASSTPRLTIEKINQIFNNIPGHIESSFNETIDSNKFGDDEAITLEGRKN
ncbi:hypothetical protein A3Q56_06684 [Intoshia linei]|uniref:PHD-type domain-containing protein n=1 Tax=Intoshia linei TaxID=1819745 RepID=A0A177AUG4_9BILA|nr:hypothetical protein A3Q56_06684 [Intoshia linei]